VSTPTHSPTYKHTPLVLAYPRLSVLRDGTKEHVGLKAYNHIIQAGIKQPWKAASAFLDLISAANTKLAEAGFGKSTAPQ